MVTNTEVNENEAVIETADLRSGWHFLGEIFRFRCADAGQVGEYTKTFCIAITRNDDWVVVCSECRIAPCQNTRKLLSIKRAINRMKLPRYRMKR